jgi:hypothetical protein
MNRRQFLSVAAIGSAGLVLPQIAEAQPLQHLQPTSIKCLGAGGGTVWLDGRTGDGSVGLAPKGGPSFSGTRWKPFRIKDNIWVFQCLGTVKGARILDGRTQNGTVGLAPRTDGPFTGTKWEVLPSDSRTPDIVTIRCLGTAEGSRFLSGDTKRGVVGLVAATGKGAAFAGTRWLVGPMPGKFDDGTNLVPADN